MAIPSYSVIKGDPQSGGVVFGSGGRNPHYRIYMQGTDHSLQVDVNIESDNNGDPLT